MSKIDDEILRRARLRRDERERDRRADCYDELVAACKSVAGVFQDAEDMPIYARKCIAALTKAGVQT